MRLHVDDKQSVLGGPFNELRLTGGFSMAEVLYKIPLITTVFSG